MVVNKPFKDILRKEYGNWLLSGNQPLKPSRNITKTSVSLLGIDLGSIVEGFKKCCISNYLSGTEDDNLWEAKSVNENTDEFSL